jgi:endonuclease/exonuclease/phosphatase family metal-dependent hydrolase
MAFVSFKNDKTFVGVNSSGDLSLVKQEFSWSVEPVPNAGDNSYYISHNKKYLTTTKDGKLKLRAKNKRQAWLINDKNETVTNLDTNKLLDVWEKNAGPLIMYDANNNENQRFKFSFFHTAEDNDDIDVDELKKGEKIDFIHVYSYNIRYDNEPTNHKKIVQDMISKCRRKSHDVICLQECTRWVIGKIKESKFVRENYEFEDCEGEMMLVLKVHEPLFRVLESDHIETSGEFEDIENRQKSGRPFISAKLDLSQVIIGTAHFWSVFDELNGNYASLTEKISAISQCFNFMGNKSGDKKMTKIIVGDTNLMQNDDKMRKKEIQDLKFYGITDLAVHNKQEEYTWDGFNNSKQIRHRERHRPDRVLSNNPLQADINVIISDDSDHYAIDAHIFLQ